jgi:hypothetical protein
MKYGIIAATLFLAGCSGAGIEPSSLSRVHDTGDSYVTPGRGAARAGASRDVAANTRYLAEQTTRPDTGGGSDR